MAETITTDTQTQPEHPTAYKEPQRLSVFWQRIALGAILLISVFAHPVEVSRILRTGHSPEVCMR